MSLALTANFNTRAGVKVSQLFIGILKALGALIEIVSRTDHMRPVWLIVTFMVCQFRYQIHFNTEQRSI